MASSTTDRNYGLVAPDTAASGSRKRKREDGKFVLGDSFVIKPHSSSVFDSSVKLTPTVALPRTYIPLQWLAGHPSRLFSIPIHPPALDTPGNVLIVKVEGERQLAAVERVGDDIYTLYKLSTQLKMRDVKKTFTQVKKLHQNLQDSVEASFTTEILDSEWWSSLTIPDFSTQDSSVSESTAKLAVSALDLAVDEDDKILSLSLHVNAPLSPPITADASLEELDAFVEPTLEDILEKTWVQYFQTLYIAKTSLAYFAKSTLSRARVAMQQEDMLRLSPDAGCKLRAFLMQMYLPFDKMDIKYRKSIPQIAMEDQIEDTSVFKPGEEEYVQQWRLATWQEKLVRANDPILKHKIEELKIRETELQIIILLEVLALEREHAVSIKTATNGNRLSPKIKSKSESKKRGKRKPKSNVPDPTLLLDLLVDRLCIWRSISSSSDELKEENCDQKKITDREHDHLRHFCVEVVLAFYASRLPDECASLNKKCGGSNSRRDANSLDQVKAKKEKRPTKTPSLLRSITAPISSAIKESNVDNLAALVAADARGTVRGGTLNSKSFAKREVQISSKSGQHKKMDEELKIAINALKKPNRVAAASELVDESTKRLSQKPRKPTRNPLAKVQVMATPKRRRTIPPTHQPPSTAKNTYKSDLKDPFYTPRIIGSRTQRDTPGTPLRQTDLITDFEMVPSTSLFESSKNRRPPAFRPMPGGLVTPQKKLCRSMGTSSEAVNFIPSSASKIQETVPRPFLQPIEPVEVSRLMSRDPFGSMDDASSLAGGVRLFSNDTVEETPCKPTAIPLGSKMVAEGKQNVSIYDSLGWDDDYDF